MSTTCKSPTKVEQVALDASRKALTPAVNARGYWSQCRALMLKTVVHNVPLNGSSTEHL